MQHARSDKRGTAGQASSGTHGYGLDPKIETLQSNSVVAVMNDRTGFVLRAFRDWETFGRLGGRVGRPAHNLANLPATWAGSQQSYNSQPGRYSRTRYLFALGRLVIRIDSESNSTGRPARRATVPRFTASVIEAALRKLPGEASPL